MAPKAFHWLAALCIFAAPLNAQDIIVTPLADINSNAVGLVSASNAGLPVDFWADTSAALISQLIQSQNHHKMPEARAFLHRLVVTELIPPHQDGTNVDMILARIDWLMANGAVDAADALMVKAGVRHPAMFKRWFDAKLMLNHPQDACAPLKNNTGLSNDIPTKVFCLAQNSDWFSAELTLVSGRQLGVIDDKTADLLSIFLDPDLMDEFAAPPVQHNADPLEFAIREALALPRPASGITLAQSHVDLDDAAGWLAQLRAGENLARVGAIPAQYLQALYTRNATASASGGVWERVTAVAGMNRAIALNDPEVGCKALRKAWHEMRDARLLHVFAAQYGTPLASISLADDCHELQVHTILLHANYGALIFDLMELIPETDILRGIVTDDFVPVNARTEIETAIVDAFARERISLINPAQSILTAMKDTRLGIESDPRRIHHLIATLLDADFVAEAQRMALQFVILERHR
jgi:hypothetical protein